ncbi:MAG: hypothetical protein U0R51_12130 [Solirubrobacterales bacterium]
MGRGDEDTQADSGEYIPMGRKLAIIVISTVSIVAAFYLGGPGLGMADATLMAALLVVMAIRLKPETPIVPPRPRDGRSHLLLVADVPLEDGESVERVAAAAAGDREPGDILVLAPHRPRFAERWTSDVDRGRERAQDCLVLTLASLAKAGVAADARVGDEDVVQAVDDQLRSYPATQVVLIDDAGGSNGSAAADELATRLRVPFMRLDGAAGERRAGLSRPARSRR